MWFNKKLSIAINIIKKYVIGHYRASLTQHDAIMREIKDVTKMLKNKTCNSSCNVTKKYTKKYTKKPKKRSTKSSRVRVKH